MEKDLAGGRTLFAEFFWVGTTTNTTYYYKVF